MGCQRLRGEDSTGGARLSILIYTQIITSAYSLPFFITPLQFSLENALSDYVINYKLLYFLCSGMLPLCPLCGVFNPSNVNSQLALLHRATFFFSAQPHPSHFHASGDFTSFSFCVLLSVIPSLSSSSSCLYLSLSVSVIHSLSRFLSPPPSLWAPGSSVGLSEEKYRFK